MVRAIVLLTSILSTSALAICNPANPNNPENDCDLDGCTVAQGDCADSTSVNAAAASIRGPGCPNGAAAEVCDAQDNNCSGATDEGNPGGGGVCATGQSGVCSPGTNQCTAGSVVCVRNVAPSAESCDGLDNDCDGTADDGNPGGGAACTTGQQGVCSAGTRTCSSGSLSCVRNVGPTTELCDGIDNDCTGGVDQGFGVGQACTSSNSGVCAPGTNQCQGNGTAACVSTVTPGTRTETCNNLDDNCNGTADEGNPGGGTACNTPLQGRCRPGTNQCQSGALNCVQNQTAIAETCNGVDDDCDGLVDDGFNVGANCGTGGVGRCSQGTFQCNAGAALCVARTAIAETCNGMDDDCDGTIDDGNPGGGVACTTGLQGVCSAGVRQCQAGNLNCVQTTASSAETCNALDDDCDGTADDGLIVDADGDGSRLCGSCGASAAPNCDCNDTTNTVRPGRPELCNNVDDDCDSQVDEGVNRVCYAGPAGTSTGTCPGTNCGPRGVCQGVTQICIAGNFPGCDAATPGQTFPGVESCNNLDDDCDGTTDDGLSGGACTTGQLGVCASGTEQCNAGGLTCVRNVNPGPETCNNLDDNCDGNVDDGVTAQRCFTGPAGTFAGSCPGPSCTPRGQCRVGSATCASGTFGSCMGQTLPVTEICDGLDNDCNGSNDNGLITDADGDGVRACLTCGAPNSPSCDCNDGNNTIRPTAAETCDALDNNCNGQVDEGSGAGGKVTMNCYSGPAGTQGRGVCVAGVQVCNATVPGTSSFGACMGQVVPSMEQCNGRDDDCNGTVDDGFDVDGDGFVSCASCNNAMNCDCNDSDPAIKPGAMETCDTIDQNCNGMLDDVPSRRCFAGPNVTPDTFSGSCPGSMCQPKGACMAGTQACSVLGAWGLCAGTVLPTNDPSMGELTCNSIDDDCDGTVDDGNFDVDLDGVRSCAGDCVDTDPAVRPGLPEICDGKDNDCDGTIDGVSTSCYGGPPETRGKGICRDGSQQCVNGVGMGACLGEVRPSPLPDGGAPAWNPDAGLDDGELLCDTRDDDCDGVVDDGFDLDRDGVTTCQGDCDDADRFNKPGLAERCDCADNDCDTTIDEGNVCVGAPCHDFDADGVTNCAGDCDDSNAAIGPQRTERVGNTIDDDCDGAVDEDTDEDGDGFSTGQGDCDDHIAAISPGAVEVCDGFDNDCDNLKDEGFDGDADFATTCAGDCDDADNTRSPFRRELCGNGVDENCDGRVDEDTDADGDGVTTCQGDCNDYNAAAHPGTSTVAVATEVCDGQDNDCNGRADEGFDVDGDFVATCLGDCNDTDATVNPTAPELAANNKDDDCDGLVDEGAADRDNDGFSAFCGDCNDADPSVNPRATEVCDRVDNDCDAYVDSAPGQFSLCAVCFDADQDGQTNCDGDCNDADPAISRGAPEVCDVKDNDCDGDVDLDPLTGLRVCTADGGGIDGGQTDGGDDGGTGSDGGLIAGDGGTPERPRVTTGCGCSSPADFAPLSFVALMVLGRRARRRSTLKAVLVAAGLLCGCTSALETPPLPDAGMVEVDGGDAGELDAGVDAGFEPLNWPCPGVLPVEHLLATLPGTDVAFAHSRKYTVTARDPAQLVVLDDAASNFAGFVLRRPIPVGIDPMQQGALELLAGREIAALASLGGTPLVRDRVERFDRVYVDDRSHRNYSSGSTLTFATSTNPFSVRNRLATALSGRPAADVGALPVVAGSATENQLIVYLMFRITPNDVYVAGAVSTLADFQKNQPALSDFTNGSHLSDSGPILNYGCERIAAPPLKTDFIFVVDNSASMLEEQAALANSAGALFAAFEASGIDFRIGVITTDSDVLRGTGFTNDLTQFKSDVRVGINGNGLEMGIEFALRAIRRARPMVLPPERRIRDDAGLVVVFVTDEENTGLKPVADYAADYLAEKAVTFGIVGPRPTGCTRVGLGSAVAGTQYIDLSTATGGSTGSICNPNITEVVEEILFGAIGASSRATLTSRPVSGSLSAKTNDLLLRARVNGFDYDPANNTLLFFGVSPPAGTDVTASYATFVYIN